MKTLLTAITFFLSLLTFAQSNDTWKVSHNSKVLLRASEEAPDKNVITINRAALTKTGIFEVSFQQASEKGWERTIMLMNEEDTALKSTKGNTLTLSNITLRALTKDKQRMMIYTISLPKDPKQRALVRVRRIHRCTIEIKG